MKVPRLLAIKVPGGTFLARWLLPGGTFIAEWRLAIKVPGGMFLAKWVLAINYHNPYSHFRLSRRHLAKNCEPKIFQVERLLAI